MALFRNKCVSHIKSKHCAGVVIAGSANCISASRVVAESQQLGPQFIQFLQIEENRIGSGFLNSPLQHRRALHMTSAHPVVDEKKPRRPSRPTVQWPELWPGSNRSVHQRRSRDVWCLVHAAFVCISSLGQDTSHPATNVIGLHLKRRKIHSQKHRHVGQAILSFSQ